MPPAAAVPLLILTGFGLLAFGRCLPCSLGRAGIAAAGAKREGDGATPAGELRITGCLYRRDRMAAPAPWARPLHPTDRWSDDPAQPGYNRLLRGPGPGSAEAMWRGDPLYDLVLTTDWNTAPVRPGRGSAIFLHRWRRPGAPTAGCLAFAPADLRWLAARAAPGARLRITAPE